MNHMAQIGNAGFSILLTCLVYASSATILPLEARAQPTATTDLFAPTNGIPASARTRFFNAPGNVDLLNTAEHELFHGIGFTTAYNNFNNRLVNRADGDRDFFSNGNANTGLLRMTLGPNARGTHTDPTLIVNGTNQNTDIMQPAQVEGQRLTQFDATPLNDAFGWNGRNLAVAVNFNASVRAAQRPDVISAAHATQILFGSNLSGPVFNWTVLNVPAAPVRGERQVFEEGARYQSLPDDTLVYQANGVTLSNLAYQFAAGQGIHQNGGTDYSLTTSLLADASYSSMIGVINLRGTTNLTVFDTAGIEEVDYDTPLSENAMKIGAMYLSGDFEANGLSIPISMILNSGFDTLGQQNIFDAGIGQYAIDSYFDVFSALSVNNGAFTPSNGSLYIAYTPEPGTVLLLCGGLVCLGFSRRHRLN